MEILVRSHSGLRWVVLGLLVIAIINAVQKKSKNATYVKKDKMINLFAMIFLHIQLLLGLILYFTSVRVNSSEGWMKVASSRFFVMEHLLGMLIAIIIVTIGRRKAEKQMLDTKKHSTVFKWYLVGLLFIIASIPWPFRTNLGITTWF